MPACGRAHRRAARLCAAWGAGRAALAQGGPPPHRRVARPRGKPGARRTAGRPARVEP